MLDHFVDLGIETIWLSPIYESPMVDNGYDVSDYYKINPKFGKMEDFDELIVEMKKRSESARGIKTHNFWKQSIH